VAVRSEGTETGAADEVTRRARLSHGLRRIDLGGCGLIRLRQPWAGVGWLVVALSALAMVAGCAERKAGTPDAAGSAAPQRIELRYSGGAVQGGVSRVSVDLGRNVSLVVTSDVADEVHLHGYDRKVEVPAGGTASLDFVADRSGVFEAELELKRVQLVQLEVR